MLCHSTQLPIEVTERVMLCSRENSRVPTSILLMAKFPCYSSRDQQRNLDQRVTVNPPSSCKKDARMGCSDTPSDD